ncbi:hypothetical protein QNO07_09220 [Streptomyces sp. 549]|uniref:hypothetical protein n=1 Tax=Streptomyces sp. 549 TaxID=3049076 RepID=UPI0024C21A8D|nr:hypothetical protein [Streptomyces sp. 549]MDK1473598.1 hypothetical protein [Streptomyces sp. 549]
MSEQTPSVGRIVHYVSHDDKECRAAIVTELTGDPDHPKHVGLAVLNPTGPDFHRTVPHHDGAETAGSPDCPDVGAHGSPFRYCACGWAEASPVVGTWHWPERV